jgi:hypothetical protein
MTRNVTLQVGRRSQPGPSMRGCNDEAIQWPKGARRSLDCFASHSMTVGLTEKRYAAFSRIR